jgi:hypothetical protein
MLKRLSRIAALRMQALKYSRKNACRKTLIARMKPRKPCRNARKIRKESRKSMLKRNRK